MPRNSVKSLSKNPNSRKTITSAKKSVNKSISKIKLAKINTRTRKSLSKIVEDPDVPESMMMSLEKESSIEFSHETDAQRYCLRGLPKGYSASLRESFNSYAHSSLRNCPVPTNKNIDMSAFIRIYRKTISNLKIREDILRSVPSKYTVGPTIIWTEIPEDLAIFTTDESYTNYIGFEDDFANPNSKHYLKKIISKMRMTKGTILIKEAPDKEASEMNIKVHFCGYKIDEKGKLFIFDPSWHSADKGIYSTTAFYDALDNFDVNYKHAEPTRAHHWQSLLLNDVFCQTWSLRWLFLDKDPQFYLPPTNETAAKLIAQYMKRFSRIILKNLEKYMSIFPAYKLEGQDPITVFETLSNKHEDKLAEIIYVYFKDKVVEDKV